MLKIHSGQMAAFKRAALQDFEDYMVEHLNVFTPKHCEVLGEPGLRRVIQFGIERAQKYEFTLRGPVRLYIELIFMLGSDFDTDPQLPWASEVLNDPGLTHQMAKADHLYERAQAYVDTIAGPHYAHVIEALHRVSQLRLEDLALTSANFDADILRLLSEFHPQKYDHVGEPRLRALIPRGIELAAQYGITADAGKALFIGLMFALGHGFATDPQFPWITATLTNPSLLHPGTRLERLHSRMMIYLKHALAYLDKQKTGA